MQPFSFSPRLAVLPALAAFAFSVSASATTVACGSSGQTITAAINALPPSQSYQTINVSGKCVENVYIPPNQAINLIAAAGSSLKPATSSSAAIDVEGRLQVSGMVIETGSFTAVFVNRGGFATLTGSTIDGTSTGVQVSDNSGAQLQNVVIKTSGNSAISTYSSGTVEIDGIAGLAGRDGTAITSTGANGSGVSCGSGHVELTTYGNGTIVFSENGTNGLYIASGCSLNVDGTSAHPVIIERTGTAGQFSAALNFNGGSGTLHGMELVDNTGEGIEANSGSSVQFTGLTITGNAGQAVAVQQNTTVVIQNYSGINMISNPAGNSNVLFGCYQGGHVYVQQIADYITPAPTSADIGCLTVGGP